MIHRNFIKSGNATVFSRLLTLIAVVVVIAGLYVGRQVLIPLALALVLAFLLAPLVSWLQRCRLGRVPAVLTVLVLAFAGVGFLGWIVTGQLLIIVDQLPSYQSTLHEKIESLRVPDGSRLKKATTTVNELSRELSAASESAVEKKTGKATGGRPIAVQVEQTPSNAPQYLRAILGPLTGVFETSAMVIVFTIFMLVRREDLRNRVIRLVGQGQLTVVTEALDDASRRLSRYLSLQFLVNTAYGVMFGVAAYWIGIPHALLWGVVSGLLRFVPYAGAPIAAALPAGMALAVFPGWHQAGMVIGGFIFLELITANIVEPWLYGAHTGISSLAILVAAVFWASLWGPVGLILSTPLTVCLILMGRYVPQLSFLEILLGDETPLPVEAHFYQRLLALDQEEAKDIAEAYLKEKSVTSFYDSVLIPALALAEQDRHLNSLDAGTANFVSQCARDLIEELGERSWDGPVLGEAGDLNHDGSDRRQPDHAALMGQRVVCIPAGDEADELVALMAEQLLIRLGCNVLQIRVVNRANVLEEVESYAPEVALVSTLSPLASGQARKLCKLLRQRQPEMTIILALWGPVSDVAKPRNRIGMGCADLVATALEQAISYLISDLQYVPSLATNETGLAAGR